MKRARIKVSLTRMVVMLGGILGFSAFPAQGATLFDNLNQSGLGQGTITNTYYKAQKFTTDQNSFTLNWVTIRLRANTQGTFFAKIYDDDNNLPRQAVGTLQIPTIGSSYANHKCTPSGPISLSPNRTYWVVVGVSSGAGYYDWNYTDSNTGSGGGFSPRWAHTTNGGSSWTAFNFEPFMMQVDVTANIAVSVPTLDQWGMIILCLFLAVSGYAVIRRQQRSKIGTGQ